MAKRRKLTRNTFWLLDKSEDECEETDSNPLDAMMVVKLSVLSEISACESSDDNLR